MADETTQQTIDDLAHEARMLAPSGKVAELDADIKAKANMPLETQARFLRGVIDAFESADLAKYLPEPPRVQNDGSRRRPENQSLVKGRLEYQRARQARNNARREEGQRDRGSRRMQDRQHEVQPRLQLIAMGKQNRKGSKSTVRIAGATFKLRTEREQRAKSERTDDLKENPPWLAQLQQRPRKG